MMIKADGYGSYTYYFTYQADQTSYFTYIPGRSASRLNNYRFTTNIFERLFSGKPDVTPNIMVSSVFVFAQEVRYIDENGHNKPYPTPRDIMPNRYDLYIPYSTTDYFTPDTTYPQTILWPDAMTTLEQAQMRINIYNDSVPSIDILNNKTVAITYAMTIAITTSFPLDLSHLEGVISSGLLSVSTDVKDVEQAIKNLQTITSNGYNSLDQRLLQVINAINSQTGSGGGTSAIVNAVNAVGQGVSAAANAIIAQQKASANQITDNADVNQAKTQAAVELVQSAVEGATEELKRQAQANIDSATNDGNKVTGMVTSMLQDTQSHWEALYFPIDFTQRIFSVFSGGTASRAYLDAYGDVVGYRYDDDTGGLVPIRADSRRARSARASGGTLITFPAFSLNLPGVGEMQIWQAHTYDLKEVTTQIPVLFDALKVISGVVLIYATVGFLVDLFHEIIEH